MSITRRVRSQFQVHHFASAVGRDGRRGLWRNLLRGQLRQFRYCLGIASPRFEPRLCGGFRCFLEDGDHCGLGGTRRGNCGDIHGLESAGLAFGSG